MCNHSLKCRVLISLLVVLMLGFGALALHLYDMRDQLRRSLMFIQAQEIGTGYTAGSDFSTLPTRHAGSELSYSLYSPNGELQWYSDNLEQARRLHRGTLQEEIDLIRSTIRSGHGQVINVPVTLADGSILMVAKNDKMERELIGNLMHQRTTHALLMLLPLCLLAAGLLFLLMQWTLRPMHKAARLAASIGPHAPEQRIPLDKLPGEILPLARAANEGLDRLARAYVYEQQVVSHAAHALRTPLAVLSLRLQKCRIEGAADRAAINEEFGRTQKLISQLLALAEQDRTQSGPSTSACLARITREAAGAMLPLFEAHNRNIELHLETAPRVRGNAGLLREAVCNVLENALHHGTGDVTITMSLAEPHSAILDIADEGDGPPPQNQEDMFQRFHKGCEASPGSGLGLAIVRSTLRNVGGDARFVSTQPCTLRLWFSRAA